MIDPLGRSLTYLRVSVTDRCDFRCTYCMAEAMTFLPRPDVLTFEELYRLCSIFIGLGIRKIRLTGGEPLVRKDVMRFVECLSRHLRAGELDELTVTTNGSQLSRYASQLHACGVRRVNISLDTLRPHRFTAITRRGNFAKTLAGIHQALEAGLKAKINMVALRGVNDDEFHDMIAWAHGLGMDVTLIETMPLGEVGEDRMRRYLPLTDVRKALSLRWVLKDIPDRTGGPATYVRVVETGGRLGFITPLTHNFCAACNRIRLSCTGMLYSCLGHGAGLDLRALLRSSDSDDVIRAAILNAISRKPRAHEFMIGRSPAPSDRTMNVTGG
jgi:GTP 3',8-cyclase